MPKYHYNPTTGAVGVCRADPSKPRSRGCRFKLESNEHYSSAEEAAQAYEATQDPFASTVSKAAVNSELTATQRNYFADSKVVDEQGKLQKVYHGSSADFDSFDPATLGRGNDTWGNGFYFTTDEATAAGYSAGSKPKEFYLALNNPFKISGKEHMSVANVCFEPEQTRSIIMSHPDLQLQPDENDERSNPLGDYLEEYWERTEHSPAQLKAMANRLYGEHLHEASWGELENFYGEDNGQAFLQAVQDTTGYDGVEVDFGKEDGKHYVAWFPTQMKLTSNKNPTVTSERFDQ